MADFAAHREMILASAGSGKTHRLSSRLIALLASGTPPGEILASTFTRKAAGEILDRVLLRLALGAADEEGAAELRESMPEWEGRDSLTRMRCGELLLRAVDELHRLHVLTLDAFFHSIIRAFSLELDLAEGWSIANEADSERLRSRAVEAALADQDPGVLIELIRVLSRGEAGREVHGLLLREVTKLHTLYRETDPGAGHLWGIPGWDEGEGAARPSDTVEGTLAKLSAAELPRTAKGTVHATWQRAMDRTMEDVKLERWKPLLEGGAARALLEGRDSFASHPISPEIRDAFHAIFRMALRSLGSEAHRKMQALGRFLPAFDAALRRLSREEGLQGFSELTDLLASQSQAGDESFLERREEVFYRLDGRIRHLLLDEFQDTSNAQWRALEPLAGEILSTGEEGRSVFIVADPKQSIYGWRGGEPGIFTRISTHYEIAPVSMAKNWRSSQVILDGVNRIFRGLSRNPALEGNEEIAAEWESSFEPHSAGREALPGFVRLEVGPAEERRGGTFAPRMLEYAARRTKEIHEQVPGATIAVLTRTNQNAETIIAHLRSMGIEASGEGGVPISDSAPVLAVLALLRMADHPGDTISSYLVAETPLGAAVGLGPGEWEHPERVEVVARKVRRRLVEEGYGKVLRDWSREIAGSLTEREALRMRQMVELAYRWDERATLRPTDFVRMVERVRMEDPAAAKVRVMTVHRAKGLEFDAVVLPDLDSLSLSGEGRDAFLPLRSPEEGTVAGVFPSVPSIQRPLFFGEIPEVASAFPGVDFRRIAQAATQSRERILRDALSALYVGVTRPRFALLILVAAEDEKRREEKRSGKRVVKSAGELVRNALAPGAAGSEGDEIEGMVLFKGGSPDWWKDPSLPDSIRVVRTGGVTGGRGRVSEVRLAPSPRTRLLPIRSPSELEGDGRVPLDRVLLAGVGREEGALRRGNLLHAWLAEVEWVETTGVPGHERLRAIAAELEPGSADLAPLISTFEGWLRSPEVAPLLTRESYPEGTRVWRERPFLVRDGERILRGIADRLLRIPDSAGDRLLILDWKSDRLDPSDPNAVSERTAFYAPQIRAYMRGLARAEGIPLERVEGALVFLGAGIIQRVEVA